MLKHNIVFVVALVLFLPGVALPRQIGYLWTYEELLAKADLVVIAQSRETVDIGTARHPQLQPAFPVVEMRTPFVVRAVLKDPGKRVAPGGELRLRHYRLDMEAWRAENKVPPGAPFAMVNGGSSLRFGLPRTYLMFLKIGTDGTYDPLSGHTFPTDSVFAFDGLR